VTTLPGAGCCLDARHSQAIVPAVLSFDHAAMITLQDLTDRDLRAHESVSSGSRPRSGEAIGVFTIHPGTSELSIVEVPTVHNTFPVTQFLGANLSLPPWHTLFHIQKVGGVMTVQKLNFFLQKVLGTF
jgi:hypothetical protein